MLHFRIQRVLHLNEECFSYQHALIAAFFCLVDKLHTNKLESTINILIKAWRIFICFKINKTIIKILRNSCISERSFYLETLIYSLYFWWRDESEKEREKQESRRSLSQLDIMYANKSKKNRKTFIKTALISLICWHDIWKFLRFLIFCDVIFFFANYIMKSSRQFLSQYFIIFEEKRSSTSNSKKLCLNRMTCVHENEDKINYHF
jgi:hypothetical protein